MLDGVDVHDGGENLILTGATEEIVNYLLAEMQKEGASNVKKAVKVGSKWVGSISNPALGLCSVEHVGYVIWIRGPSESAIVTKSHELRERGALVATLPHQESGQRVMSLE
ncbi:MAG: hypothetical protein HYY28_03335, partial [Betaproteobacteria bacterium]|nr:hypothetical protein [Betaproteobacteria bacterium]